MSLDRRTPRFLPTTGKVDNRFFAEAVNNILNGRMDAVGEVTLAENAASTAVTDTRVVKNSAVILTPMTANAAAAIGTTYIPEADYGTGTFTIRHANNPQTDRSFRYIILS
ncbi:MAG TPA: hypothetical protein DCO82_02365 [Alphaproteobacteria bacterium]|nr:hypothetical protein [Alphaproteobacteria bacterium]